MAQLPTVAWIQSIDNTLHSSSTYGGGAISTCMAKEKKTNTATSGLIGESEMCTWSFMKFVVQHTDSPFLWTGMK